MTANVGMADRAVRALLGVALLVYFFIGEGDAHWLGLIGVVPLLTAVAGWCPAYRLFGMSTCGR